ncbi:hypothetical protein [uncultured Variovorax sp.]|uniref:hypothetical protein n=1 Tax=uncultured Variovorax sp. TaxID=114708 RepID=UPI002612D3D6|nr:hypothetical protein [uncultured Variovorax sp.]
MTRAAPVPPRDPWTPAQPSKAVHYALTNLQNGTASDVQQKLALDWILNAAARTYDQPFRPGGADGARATDFSAGMMFVGQQIVRALKLDPQTLEGPAHGA